jgi:cell division protein FtsI (penicillin-binding protein 3)
MQVKRDILWRVYISFIGLALLGAGVVGRAFYIQRFQGAYWKRLSDSLHQRYVTLDAQRGTIYSEDGQFLSTSIPTFDIYLDLCADGLREKKGRRFKENIDSFCVALSGLFRDQTPTQYKTAITAAYEKKSRYYPLKKKLSFAQYKAFRELPLVRLGPNRSGVIVETNSKRLLPYGILAGRTIGLSREHLASDGKIRKQNVGLERSYDSLLSGKEGVRLVRFIAGGAAIPIAGSETEPENGKDIYTTIDLPMQDITETALMRMMVQSDALYGTAIVMETATGKIKAMANLGRRPDGHYWEDDNYALRATEPGSTIKLATLLAVLEKGTSRIDDPVEIGSAGRAMVGPKMVIDAERSPKPFLTVKECYAHSSNVGMSKLALKAFGKNPQEIKTYFTRFHLDKRAEIDLSNVPRPSMAPLTEKGSSLGNMLWMSFGYAIQVSPLHTLTLYNAVANGGKMMKPYLVSRIQQGGTLYREIEPTVLEEQVCKPEVIAAARSAMEAVVTEGTARRAFDGVPFAVAGKTGTALVSDGPIKYGDRVYQASFVGYFPADRPQYTCIVVVRTKPFAASHYGGTVAAPVFREIATKVYAMYVDRKDPSQFVKKSDSTIFFYAGYGQDLRKVFQTLQLPYADSMQRQPWVKAYNPQGKTVLKAQPLRPKVMPNVKGMGLKDALFLLENMGVKVQVKGRGRIVSQSVAPGTALDRPIQIVLELS